MKRRTPAGTQPPISATEPAKEAAGLIVIHPKPDRSEALAAHRREQQRSIIVADDDWLERLDLPAD